MNETHLASVRVEISGLVQGVSFRAFTVSIAERLGLTGYAMNLPGGESVLVEAEGEKTKLKSVGRAIAHYVGFGWYPYQFKSAMGPPPPAASEAEQGSERPTLENESDGKFLKRTGPKDFRSQRVFLTESKKVFVSDRAVLSGEGREYLDSVANFVSKAPTRLVIIEAGPGEKDELGMDRTIAAIKHLGSKGVPKEWCNMGIKGTLPEKVFKAERMLEITLLEEGVYK